MAKKIVSKKEETPKNSKLESVFVFSENAKEFPLEISEILKKHQVQVVTLKDWGVKILSRPIKKQTSGHYHFSLIELPVGEIVPLRKELTNRTEVLRFSFIRSAIKKSEGKSRA